ncbi:MAG: hypothetical protein DHS20C09_03130 [marine bacterium B5-7]|nr:MAG: hypothetical protein DHS20C09_03130 [marine bacterium B5-7]
MIKNSIKYEDLINDFEGRNIPFDTPGFYDHPNFMQVEEKNASYLSNYAKFVDDRPREQSYDDYVKHTVPSVAKIFSKKFIEHGDLKPDTSVVALVSKALEKMNIWNYVVRGSITLNFPAESGINTRYFFSLDHDGFKTAHVWLVVPPFYIVDITLSLHPFSEAETSYIAPLICAEENNIIEPEIEDVISEGYCAHLKNINVPRSDYFSVISPQTEKFLSVFPSREVISDELKIKYIPISVSAPDVPFEQMTAIRFAGQTASDIYENEIKGLL